MAVHTQRVVPPIHAGANRAQSQTVFQTNKPSIREVHTMSETHTSAQQNMQLINMCLASLVKPAACTPTTIRNLNQLVCVRYSTLTGTAATTYGRKPFRFMNITPDDECICFVCSELIPHHDVSEACTIANPTAYAAWILLCPICQGSAP